MFTPHRASASANELANSHTNHTTLILRIDQRSIVVTHDGFSIGSSRQCDLRLNEPLIQPLHSLIHMQAGAIWIQAADDETTLVVNGIACRRMALRQGDQLKLGATELTIQFGTQNEAAAEQAQLPEDVIDEDLDLLTAEELCDRIVSEQELVRELSAGQDSGWEALLHAIQAVNEEPVGNEQREQDLGPLTNDAASYDALLEQIQELNDTIVDRTLELTVQEAEVLASTSILEESQQRVAQRLDKFLDQLNQTETPPELRASA